MAEDNPSFSTDSHLQIGIEIEFVAPRNTAWENEHLPFVDHWNHASLSKDACFHRLAEALHAGGLPSCYQMKTTPLRCLRNPLLAAAPRDAVVLQSCRLLGDPLRYRVRDGRAGLFRYWLVKGEHNLTDVAAYKTWIECELNTPVLAEADVAAADDVDRLPQLGTALAALHAADADAPPHVCPRRCGMHVHLSLAAPGGCTLDYARRVLTLALVLDQSVLYPLCDRARRDLGRPFLSAASLASRADLAVPHAPRLSARALAHLPPGLVAAEGRALAYLWHAASFDELQLVLEHHRADLHTVAPVLCKHKHAAGDGGAPGGGGGATATTVEFRCAQASFSARFVRAWARLVLAAGRVALLPADEYRAALGRMWAAAQVSGGTVAEREEATMATLGELSVAAVEAGMLGGGLDLAYWRVRYGLMRDGRNPDIDEEGRAVLDQD
ncbi:hypothetical protein MY11210_007975 [Beauveria gryllotalpidicola]